MKIKNEMKEGLIEAIPSKPSLHKIYIAGIKISNVPSRKIFDLQAQHAQK